MFNSPCDGFCSILLLSDYTITRGFIFLESRFIMKNQLVVLKNGKMLVSSLELLDEINFFRAKDNQVQIGHNDLLKIIRDEFSEEIGLGEISQSSYKNSQSKSQPMFELSPLQAKQLLARESKSVRKALMLYIEQIEDKLRLQSPQTPLLIGSIPATDNPIISDEIDNIQVISDIISERFKNSKTGTVYDYHICQDYMTYYFKEERKRRENLEPHESLTKNQIKHLSQSHIRRIIRSLGYEIKINTLIKPQSPTTL